MHRNDEKPVCTQPRQIDQHRLTRLTNTPGATTSPLGAHNHKKKKSSTTTQAQRKGASHPETTQEAHNHVPTIIEPTK